jgi:hypothetical protein
MKTPRNMSSPVKRKRKEWISEKGELEGDNSETE